MMNTRLQNRMTESEILKIFSDTVEVRSLRKSFAPPWKTYSISAPTQAVAHMHYQSPPLIHRDLKVENILLTPPQTYKLCDFGSTTKPLPREKVPTAVEGIQKIELEINKTTTLQYRAPELVDVWGRKGFDEKIGKFPIVSFTSPPAAYALFFSIQISGRSEYCSISFATTPPRSKRTVLWRS